MTGRGELEMQGRLYGMDARIARQRAVEVLQHLDLIIERLLQARSKILALDILLDAIGEAVKTALAPPREVEHCFAQGFGRDRSCMHGDTAEAGAALDDKDGFSELGGLDGGAAAGWSRTDDDEIEMFQRKAPGSDGAA